MTRWKAAGIHLALSLLIVGGVATFTLLVWFPHGLFRIASLDRLLITMLGVDIVIGPLLTCIVYKRGKPSLRRDLAVIALLQATFLGYGLHTAWITRPVYLVWSINQATLVFANEMEAQHQADARTSVYRNLPWLSPRQVAVVLPTDNEEKKAEFTRIIHSGTIVERMPRYYRPYTEARAQILRNSTPLSEWPSAEGADDPRLQAAAAGAGRPVSRLNFAPIESTRDTAILLLDSETAEPLDVVVRNQLP